MGLPEESGGMATPKLKARGKGIASKHPKFAGYESPCKPEVKIMKCISFQKFRYCGENRPGKKYQDKDFIQLALCNMSGRNVQIQIVCFDAERQDEIHPNGLVGRDCYDGVYMKTFPISKTTQIVRIPYLRTERILTKKTQKDEKSKICTVFEKRAKILPSPYRERCLRQSEVCQKYDTTRVCFGIIALIEGSTSDPLFCISNVVQNASEKTMLKIHKLSTQYVSAQEGGELDIFTSEDGPPITAGKCTLKVVVKGDQHWESAETKPTQEQILYKRVVTYRVPEYAPHPATDVPVRAHIQLSCVQSGQICSFEFCYEPGADSARKLATIHSNKPLRKRPYMTDPADDIKYSVNGADNIKLRVKEKVKSRQNQVTVDSGPTYDLHRSDHAQSNLPVTVCDALSTAMPASAVSTQDGGVPLHQQEDIVLAKDLVTGEVVYIRTQQNQSSDIVMYVHDAQQALSSGGLTMLSDAPRAIAVPASEWSSMATPSTAATSASTLRTLDSASQIRGASSHQLADHAGPVTRKTTKFCSPWVVDDPKTTPLLNGDISFNQPRTEAVTVSYLSSSTAGGLTFKQEPTEMGPPILLPTRMLNINSETVPGVSNNLPSGTLISSSNLPSNSNLPSLGSLFSMGVLEGVRFDDAGNLLSSSVYEMVSPYIEKVEK